MLLRLIAVLCPLGGVLANFAPIRDGFDIRIRGDGDQAAVDGLVSPYCFAPCDPDSCNLYVQDTCTEPPSSPGNVQRRSLAELFPYNVPWDGAEIPTNHTSLQTRAPSSLTDLPWIKPRDVTKSKIASYLPGQILSEESHDAPNPEYRSAPATYGWIVRGDVSAVGLEATFGNNPIQFASGGLHGCTVVTLVSQTAVWMAHFWETYSWGFGQTDTPQYDDNFDERVLQFIRRNAVSNPTNTKPPEADIVQVMRDGGLDPSDPGAKRPTIPDYITPTGNGPDPDNYNKATDKPYLFIMTPLVWNQYLDTTAVGDLNDALFTQNKIRYPTKVRRMIETFFQLVPNLNTERKPRVSVFGYNALNYNDERDREQSNTNERGMAMVQYNPNGKGTGKKAWRLFYQQFYQDLEVKEPSP